MKIISLALFALLAAGCTTTPPPRTNEITVFHDKIQRNGTRRQWFFVTPQNGVVDASTTPPDDENDLSYKFRLIYDDDALIVLASVLDDVRVTDSCAADSISCPAWDDDAVEIFIDGNLSRRPDSRVDGVNGLKNGGEFALVANGAANSDYSGYPNSFGKLWSGEVRRTDQFNTTAYEFRITWAAMGRTNRPECIGFNISVQDDDDGGRRDHALYWRGNPQLPFADEREFGVIEFK